MSFWSIDTVRAKSTQGGDLISPFLQERMAASAYELSMGAEAFVTTDASETKQKLGPGEQVPIAPGQFGLLLAEEVVKVPSDAIAFISIKAGVKFRGLVNVSGFHVDPGYSGQLMFGVYNAGSRPVVVSRGEPLFMIWFADLDQATSRPYSGQYNKKREISPNDVMKIQGEVASPAELRRQLDILRSSFQSLSDRLGSLHRTVAAVAITIGAGLVVGIVVGLFLLFAGRVVEPAPPPGDHTPAVSDVAPLAEVVPPTVTSQPPPAGAAPNQPPRLEPRTPAGERHAPQ